eukprot:7365191-Ditylum_brightwellii.AAC.1
MVAFGMKTTLVQFQDKYYNYKGVVENDTEETNDDDNGLAIGAYEAAFCADTGATFKTTEEVIRWVCNFQLQVNKVVGGTFFQFTAEVWNPQKTQQLPTVDEEIPTEEWNFWAEKFTIIDDNSFPYLDMQLSWKQDNLCFLVYIKENQTIKYVRKESCHCQSVFKAVPA